MRGALRKVFLLLAVASLSLAGCGSVSSYAIEINGRQVSQQELNRELEAVLDNRQYLQLAEDALAPTGQRARGQGQETLSTFLVARLLERRVLFELIHQEVLRRKVKVTEEDRRAAESAAIESSGGARVFNAFPQDFRDEQVQLRAEVSALQRELAPKVDEAAVRRFYDGNPQSFQESCVRHIQVDNQAKAAEIKGRIAAGEDFAAVARAESTAKQPPDDSANRGGDLGCVPRGRLGPEFEAAMGNLQPGQVSDPVQTQFGFHLIQVTGRRMRPFEEASPEIRQRLEAQSPEALQKFLDDALAKAKVKVNPRYGKVSKEQGFEIVPPSGRDEPNQPPGPPPQQ